MSTLNGSTLAQVQAAYDDNASWEDNLVAKCRAYNRVYGHEGRQAEPGPKVETLEIESNWQDAVRKALQKKPASGWPKAEGGK